MLVLLGRATISLIDFPFGPPLVQMLFPAWAVAASSAQAARARAILTCRIRERMSVSRLVLEHVVVQVLKHALRDSPIPLARAASSSQAPRTRGCGRSSPRR